MSRTSNGLPGTYNATQIVLSDQEGAAVALDINANSKTTLATTIAGEDLTNDVLKVEQRVSYLNGTASALVKTGAGRFFGVVVNSHASGTLKFWDNTSAATTVLLNTYTFPAGSGIYVFPVAINFSTGLYATVGGTIDYTILYN